MGTQNADQIVDGGNRADTAKDPDRLQTDFGGLLGIVGQDDKHRDGLRHCGWGHVLF